MSQRIVVAHMPAWLSTARSYKVGDFRSNDPESVVEAVAIFRTDRDMSGYGYVRVGDADITLTINDDDSLRDAAVESLREQIKAVRAEAENKITELTRRINELQAIEYAEQGK